MIVTPVATPTARTARHLGHVALATLAFAVVALAAGVGVPVLWHALFHGRSHEADVAMAIAFAVPATLLPGMLGFALATLAEWRAVADLSLGALLRRACVAGIGASMLCWGWLFAVDALLHDVRYTTRLWAVSAGAGLLALLVAATVYERTRRR